MTQTKTSVSHRVLLVDDDEAVRDMMSATLEAKGFDVVPASQRDGSPETDHYGKLRRAYHGPAHAEPQ